MKNRILTPILLYSFPIPAHLILLIVTNMAGTFLAVTSSSWLIVWLGLVLNLLSLIPIITPKKTAALMESATKYFILQSLASTMLIMTILLMNYLPYFITTILLTSSLMLKLGAAPLHFWVPQVLQHLNWAQILLISTWQKIAPLAIMTTFSNHTQSTFILAFAMISLMVGALGAWSAPSLKHLLAFSSIHHTGWLILLTISSYQTTALYFAAYAIQMIILVTILNFIATPNKPPFLLNPENYTNFLISMSLIFLSMAAMPPFMGFIPKLAALFTLFSQNLPILIMLLIIISALIMTSVYLTLAMTLITPPTSNTYKPFPAHLEFTLALTLTTILYLPTAFMVLA